MAVDKKLVGYTKINVSPDVPTSIDAALVRNIESDAFENLVSRTIFINTYANDISGAPWGAKDSNVVWKKSPMTTIHYNNNGGSGSMVDEPANIGLEFKLP